MLKDQGSASRPQRSHELSVPLYSPRTSYNNICSSDESYLVDLTLNFDSYTINVMKAEFKARNGKMPFLDFVLILKDQLSNWQKDLPFREKRLLRVLSLLFDEININGNGVLEWTEFTTYIVDKATVLNTMKSKNDEIKAYTPVRLKIAKKFDALLTKVIYLEDIDRVAFLEEGSDEIHFLNHETGAFNPKPLKVTPPKDEDAGKASKVKVNSKGGLKSHAEKSMVLDMIYVREKKSHFLLTSSDDCAIRTWRYSSNGFVNTNAEEEGAIYFSQAQVCIAWDEINQILYSGQRDGAINIWDRKSDTIIGKLHQDGHTDLIMDIIPLPKLQLVATCSLDKTIILWNTITNKKVRVFKEHTRGVVSLAFNKSLILLVSGGYDHQICVWNPYIDNAVFKITAHSSPLVGVKMVEGSSQFVSLDTSGTIKIWDFKKFSCIQTLSLETVEDQHKFHPQAFGVIPKPRKLVLAGRSLNFFEYDKNYNANAVDDSVAVGVCYRPQNNTILTPTGNKIKVWNALTGEIKRIYSDISQSEITVFKLDEIKKRCLIGFSNGEAGAYNVLNGALLKTYTKHSSELTHILEAKDLGFIITASASDGTIKVHTDKTVNESELARVITLQEVALTAIVYQSLNRLIVTGTQNGIVAFWEAETGKFLGQCACFGQEEIASIVVLKDLDYVIAATSTGKIGIIVTPPSTLRYNKIFEFINYDDDGLKVPVYPVHMIWSHEKKYLFIADDRSWLKVYDLSDKIEDLYKHEEIEKETKLKEANSSKFTLRLPNLSTAVPNKIWAVKAHNDPIKSLEYAEAENLLFTSALDKKVKIWNAETGKYIDALQQKYDGLEPTPIAYKKPGFEGIYSPDLSERVDLEHTNKVKNEILRNQAELRALAEKYNIEASAVNKLGSLKTLKTMGSIKMSNLEYGSASPKRGGQRDKEEEKKDSIQDRRKLEPKASILFTGKHGEGGDNKQRQALESVILSAYGGDEIGRTLTDIEEEEFDPFYNWRKIDIAELEVKDSSPWRLHVNFQENKSNFDHHLVEIGRKLHEAEKNDVVGRLTADQPLNSSTSRATEPDDPNLSDKRALVDQEAHMMRKAREQEKKKEKNIEAVIGNQLKEGHIMKGAIQYQNDNKYSQVKSKIGALHNKVLKGKTLDKHKKVVSLTTEEAEAAKRLADALSSYDKDDQRNVKFLEFQVKQQRSDKERKDFININKQKFGLNAGAGSVTGRSELSESKK